MSWQFNFQFGFTWEADASPAFALENAYFNVTSSCDENHVFYLGRRAYNSADGSFLWNDVTYSDLTNAINAFAGSTVCLGASGGVPSVSNYPIRVTPILGGRYLITWMAANSAALAVFDKWFCILAPPTSFNQLT